MLRRSNPISLLSSTSFEPTVAGNVGLACPQLFTNRAGRARSRRTRIVVFALLVAFLSAAAASEARATVWTKNQKLYNGPAPSAILPTDDLFPPPPPSYTGPISPGQPIHIVYGIQDAIGNSGQISLTINLPAAFMPTTVRWAKFPGGTGSSTGSAIPSASNLTIPLFALSGSSDKVIVVIDGFFTQAGHYSVPFVPTRGTTTEPTSITVNASSTVLPADVSITKEVKPKTSGTFGSTATIAFGATVTYKLTIQNLSTSTDLYLGKLLQLQDTLSNPSANDVPLSISLQSFLCQPFLGADCPTMPSGSIPMALPAYQANQSSIPNGFTYPTGSQGYLPANGKFEITFEAVITTTALCSPSQNNQLFNVGFFTYSDGTNTLSDPYQLNNTSSTTTVFLTGLPPTGCPSPSPTPTIPVTKTLLNPSNGAWNAPFTYQITITNNSTQTLTGLGIKDLVTANNTPPFSVNLPTNVTCPLCSSFTSATSAPVVNNQYTYLFSASFSQLLPGHTQTVTYTTQYVASCGESNTPGSITNYVYLTGPAAGAASVITSMPPLPLCLFQVTKNQTSGPTSFSSFPLTGVTLGYQVQFKNISPTSTIVGTLIDAMALDSQSYGDVPVDYSYSCTPNGVTGIPTSKLSYTSPITPQSYVRWANPLWAGTKLIDFSGVGAVFASGGTLTCQLTVTLKQPSETDSLCQGAGAPQLRNSAFMALTYPYDTNLMTQPTWYQQVTTPLPHCVSIIVGKTAPSNVYAGAPVTFTLTVTNVGNDPTPPNIHLIDNVPPTFGSPSWSPVSGPGGTGTIAGHTVTVDLNTIPGGGTTTINVTATAPTTVGAYCNPDKATFNPLPALTYFEGTFAQLTNASACIQVNPPTPPKLDKRFAANPATVGQPVYVVFTITNGAGQPAQSGLNFSDALPNPPFSLATLQNNGCGGTVSVSGNIVTLHNGSVPAGPSQCTLVFQATPTKCGIFENDGKNIHESAGVDYHGLDAGLDVKCTDPPPKPTLTKRFNPPVINLGQSVQVIFTLTNPAGAMAQSGLSFSDSLPNPPFTSGMLGPNTCGGTANVNGNLVSLANASLPAGPSQCTVVFLMAPPNKCGTFRNNRDNIHDVFGLDTSQLNAYLTINCGERVEADVRKIAFVPANFAGSFNFNVSCTPPGGSPVTSIKTISFTSADPLTPYKGLKAKNRTVSMGLQSPGTTCIVNEGPPMPPPPVGCSWQPPTYAPPSASITVTATGSNRVDVFNHLVCGAPRRSTK
jgi:uncharacterized repeat protein (TIGR01451 family)